MNKKITEQFIDDKRRRSYLGVIYNSIYRGKSILIEGDYGVGKSRFLELVKPKKLKLVRLESLDKIHEILAAILEQLNYDVKPAYHLCSRHLKMITSLNDFMIVVDESNDLDPRLWPYFKRIIDAKIPMLFTGLPKVRTYLSNEHPDILSRLKLLILYPLIIDDLIQEYNSSFEAESIEQIYAATGSDLRKFKEICRDCRDKADELKQSKVDINLTLSILSDYIPGCFNYGFDNKK
jgi:hypothetical protein